MVENASTEDSTQDSSYTEDALGTDEGTKNGDEPYTENASGTNKVKSAPRKVKGAQVAADGTYPAYFSVAKYEDGKYKKNYTGILYVVVSDGKISALDYSGDKEKKIKKTLQNSGYIGQTASVSVIQGVDATSSASLNVNGSTSASSSGKSYGNTVSHISVTKEWASGVTDDEKADTVVATVTASDGSTREVKLTSDNWTGSLPVESNGTYTVSETSATKDGTDITARFTSAVTKGTA